MTADVVALQHTIVGLMGVAQVFGHLLRGVESGFGRRQELCGLHEVQLYFALGQYMRGGDDIDDLIESMSSRLSWTAVSALESNWQYKNSSIRWAASLTSGVFAARDLTVPSRRIGSPLTDAIGVIQPGIAT